MKKLINSNKLAVFHPFCKCFRSLFTKELNNVGLQRRGYCVVTLLSISLSFQAIKHMVFFVPHDVFFSDEVVHQRTSSVHLLLFQILDPFLAHQSQVCPPLSYCRCLIYIFNASSSTADPADPSLGGLTGLSLPQLPPGKVEKHPEPTIRLLRDSEEHLGRDHISTKLQTPAQKTAGLDSNL